MEREDVKEALETEAPTSPWVNRATGFALSFFVDVLVVLVLAALAWTVWLVGVDLYRAIVGEIEFEVKNLFVEILTVFIFIEIFHSLLDYTRTHRIHIRKLTDVSMAIVFRELWIGLFGLALEWPMVIAFAVVILALGAVRVAVTRHDRPQNRAEEDSEEE